MNDYQRQKDKRRSSSVEGWRGLAGTVDLGEADSDLLDLALCVYPDLRFATFLGHIARSRGLRFPVQSVDDLLKAIGEDRWELGEHLVDSSTVADAMATEDFPMAHEGELLSAIHRALMTCRVTEVARRHQGLAGPTPPPQGAER